MAKPQSNLDELMNDPKAAGLLKNKAALMGLISSPDTQKLIQMLNQNAGGSLKGAADAAAKGDASQLMGLVNQIMGSKEGSDVVDRINKRIPKDKG